MKSFTWKGIVYNSIEHLQVSEGGGIYDVHSSISGFSQGKNYNVKYRAEISEDWMVMNFQIAFTVNGKVQEITGVREAGNWNINGEPDPRFADFCFIDISLSPFTNTLPINNLDMVVGQEQEIAVMYIDILNAEVTPVRQRYCKLSETIFRYENVSDDFRADIQVDEYGFVTFYPGLFERVTSPA